MMFTADRSSNLYQESLKSVPLYCREWGFRFVCSGKNKLGRNAVAEDKSLLR